MILLSLGHLFTNMKRVIMTHSNMKYADFYFKKKGRKKDDLEMTNYVLFQNNFRESLDI